MSLEDTDPPLPPELWNDNITPCLGIKDSCSLALVSNSMWPRSREHKKWRNLRVDLHKIRERGATALFQCPSFEWVKKLTLFDRHRYRMSQPEEQGVIADNVELLSDLLRCSLHCSTLKEIEFDIDISGVAPELLASAIAKLNGVIFSGTSRLTNQQVTKILEESPKLSKLVMPHTKLTDRSVQFIGNITSFLKHLDLSGSQSTTEQIEVILEKCLESAILKDLSLDCIDLSGIPAEFLAKVISRLDNVSLHYTRLSPEQITTMFKAISSTSSTLKRICLSNVDLSNVSEEVLSKAMLKLEHAKLMKTQLTPNQQLQILVGALSSSTIKKVCFLGLLFESVTKNPTLYNLSLSHKGWGPYLAPAFVKILLEKAVETGTLYMLDLSGINLTSIPPSLIAKVASDLYSLNLHYTSLSSEAITIILQALLQSKRIKKLDLSDNTLTHVCADLLADVTKKLAEINLEACRLTAEQSTKVLQTSAKCSIRFNDLSNVNPDVLYKMFFFRNILSNTSLSTAQFCSIFQKYCQSEEVLVDFDISYQNLSNVPVGLLSQFVSKFSKVSMTDCNLTKEQVIGILQMSIKSTSLKTLDLYGNKLFSSMPANLIEKLYELKGENARFIYRLI